MSHSYDAPNGTTFIHNPDMSGNVDIVTRDDERIVVRGSDLIAFFLQLPLDAVSPLCDRLQKHDAATVRKALEALGRVVGWDVNETRAGNEKRWEK